MERFFTFTHQLTLPPYALISCLLQLGLFTAWYAQMANHSYLQERADREAERGKRMRQYGWGRCIRSVLRDHDDELDPTPADAQRMECVCGCCFLFSTSCTLWVFNLSVLATLVYLLLIGSGTLESTSRYSQAPECRVAMPAALYVYTLNAALLLLYVVLIIVRVMCSARNVVQNVVHMGKHIRNRVQTRRAFRRTGAGAAPTRSSTYAQLGRPVDAELGLELSDDERMEEGDEHVELDLEDLCDEGYMDEPSTQQEEEHKAEVQLQQPKPKRPTVHMLQSPPPAHVSSSSPRSHSPPMVSPLSPDDDTREMLEMLETQHHGGQDQAGSDNDLQLAHQRQAEATLDRMEAQTSLP